MPDVFDRATRSRNMAAIRGHDTKPELLVRRFLHRSGLRYRLHMRSLPGRPDIVLPRLKTVVFVHGCSRQQLPPAGYIGQPNTPSKKKQAKTRGRL